MFNTFLLIVLRFLVSIWFVVALDLLLALHQFHGLHDDGGDVVLVLDDDVEGVRLVAQFLLVMGRFQDGLPFAEDIEGSSDISRDAAVV